MRQGGERGVRRVPKASEAACEACVRRNYLAPSHRCEHGLRGLYGEHISGDQNTCIRTRASAFHERVNASAQGARQGRTRGRGSQRRTHVWVQRVESTVSLVAPWSCEDHVPRATPPRARHGMASWLRAWWRAVAGAILPESDHQCDSVLTLNFQGSDLDTQYKNAVRPVCIRSESAAESNEDHEFS